MVKVTEEEIEAVPPLGCDGNNFFKGKHKTETATFKNSNILFNFEKSPSFIEISFSSASSWKRT